MGSAGSKAESILNQCLSAGISVVNKNLAQAESDQTQDFEVFISGCAPIIHDIYVKQFAKFNTVTAAQLLTNTDIMQDMENKIKEQAESIAKAGLFVASAESRIVNNITMQLSAAVKNSCASLASNMSSQIASIRVADCPADQHAQIYRIAVDQRVEMISASISKSTDVTKATQSLKTEVEHALKAYAKGFDITIILIVIVVVVLFVVMGPAGAIVKAVFDPNFWFLGSLAAVALGAYLAVAAKTGKLPPCRNDKRKPHNGVFRGGLITAGVGAVVAVITGYVLHKKQIAPKVVAPK